MQEFKDDSDRPLHVPTISVKTISDIRSRVGVDLWHAVQGKIAIDGDVEKLYGLFRYFLRDQYNDHGIKGEDIAEVFIGNTIQRFIQAVELELVRFFPSPLQPLAKAAAEMRTMNRSQLSEPSGDTSEQPD